jgi:hypothetical protein
LIHIVKKLRLCSGKHEPRTINQLIIREIIALGNYLGRLFT